MKIVFYIVFIIEVLHKAYVASKMWSFFNVIPDI